MVECPKRILFVFIWPKLIYLNLNFYAHAGISDYKDGLTTKKWQNYASLAAAAVVKSIICGMDAPTNV